MLTMEGWCDAVSKRSQHRKKGKSKRRRRRVVSKKSQLRKKGRKGGSGRKGGLGKTGFGVSTRFLRLADQSLAAAESFSAAGSAHRETFSNSY